MHLHAHLAMCVREYGPHHGFWLFSFERYNGVLGSQPHNNRSIEIQLMNRFLRDKLHLELLHRADTKPLAEIFGHVVHRDYLTCDNNFVRSLLSIPCLFSLQC